jgi:hypothetical protein
MRDFTYDLTTSLIRDAVWTSYDTAQAIANVLSDNLNIDGIKLFLEANVSVVSTALEALELLMKLADLFLK